MGDLVTFKSSNLATYAVDYPESDGKPMGETEFHINVIMHLLQSLRHFYRRDDDVYVAANLLLYYEEGNRAAFKVPDVFVVRGVAKYPRRTYKLWEEGVAPCAVFEITSRGTWLEDLGEKRALYEKLGVPEYFLFDPLDEYLSPRLQGFRLEERYYQQPIGLRKDGTLTSRELGVTLQPDDQLLRIIDPKSGEAIPTLDEAARRADDAEAKAARLEAELKKLRGQLGDEV